MSKIIIGNIEIKGKLLGKEEFARGTVYIIKISLFPHRPKIIRIIESKSQNDELKVTI